MLLLIDTEGSMSKLSNCLVTVAVGVTILLWVGVSLGEVTLHAPQVQVLEGDRIVELKWHDPDPEVLVSVEEPVLGSGDFPWHGHAEIEAGGFYVGACDWPCEVNIGREPGTGLMEFTWEEVVDWTTFAETQETDTRRDLVTEFDQVVELSEGIQVMVRSPEGILEPDFAGWSGPVPGLGGVYRDVYADPDPEAQLDSTDYEQPVMFEFTCTSGGELTSTGGDIAFEWEARIAWPDGKLAPDSTLLASGAFVLGRADTLVEVHEGFRMAFPAGTFSAGEAFTVDAYIPLAVGDRFIVNANTFEGYLVLRHSVEDRGGPGDGIESYKVIAALSKCDSFELFMDSVTVEPDPFGTREYLDEGITVDQPGVDPDPDVKTVLNGFPYDYAVVTFDWSEDHEQVLSEIIWQRVFPSVEPDSTTTANVRVVPNPYIGSSSWETGGEAKIQFTNIPIGAKIRIYDAAGGYINTVRPNTYSYDSGKQQGVADWNLKDSDGEDVVSGIYVYRIESKVGSDTGRFIVVR
jgi:hypothetical protein